jgi:hypothetical protein
VCLLRDEPPVGQLNLEHAENLAGTGRLQDVARLLARTRQRVRAFRLAPRLRQVVRGDPALNRVAVTVLPNFEVHVEAPSYPDRELATLYSWCRQEKEDGPAHLLCIDRKMTVEWAAQQAGAPAIAATLEKLSGRPLPANVAHEVREWCHLGDQLVLYEGIAVVEVRGDERLQATVRQEMGALAVGDGPPGFVLAREPDRVLEVLERSERVPLSVSHRSKRFTAKDGVLAAGESAPGKQAPALPIARLSVEDFAGYRSGDPACLKAIQEELLKDGVPSHLGDGLLLVPATGVPRVRKALRRLRNRYRIELE